MDNDENKILEIDEDAGEELLPDDEVGLNSYDEKLQLMQLEIINLEETNKILGEEFLISKYNDCADSLLNLLMERQKNVLKLKRELYQNNPDLLLDIYSK